MKTRLNILGSLSAGVLGLLIFAGAAQGVEIFVNDNGDSLPFVQSTRCNVIPFFPDTLCTLRDAIYFASNSYPGSDVVIRFKPGSILGVYSLKPSDPTKAASASNPYVITLANGELLIASGATFASLHIVANDDNNTTTPYPIEIDANGLSRVFNIQHDNVKLGRLRISGGKLVVSGVNGTGAGVWNNAGTFGSPVRLEHCLVTGNTTGTASLSASGAGVFNDGGYLEIGDTTIADNQALGPAGANGSGAGLWVNRGMVSLDQVTITKNTANTTAGGIGVSTGNTAAISISNSIVAGNTDSQGAASTTKDFAPGDATIVNTRLALSNNVIGGDPRLNDLADNGGPTLTMSLLADSPAYNPVAGFTTSQFDHDQRGPGFPRLFGPTIDIGAYENELQITCPDAFVVLATGPDGISDLAINPVVTDPSDLNPVVTCDNPALLPVGDTTVTCSATSVQDEGAHCTVVVTVAPEPPAPLAAPGCENDSTGVSGGLSGSMMILFSLMATLWAWRNRHARVTLRK